MKIWVILNDKHIVIGRMLLDDADDAKDAVANWADENLSAAVVDEDTLSRKRKVPR